MEFAKTSEGLVYFVHQPFAFKKIKLTYQAIRGYHLFKVIIVNTRSDTNTYYFTDDGINELVSLMNDSYSYKDGWYEIR